MLFNSYAFIFAFLPVTLLGYHWLARRAGPLAAIQGLIAASLFFYGWWNPVYLLLLGVSLLGNYWLAQAMLARKALERSSRSLLIVGVAFNLGLLGWFKYAGFFATVANDLGAGLSVPEIVLPLAISFFTFQQIAFLADVHAGQDCRYDFTRYTLFVTFFPQLIAGPIVHHNEMLPQFSDNDRRGLRADHLALGLTVFSFGLVKKAIFADGIAVHASPVFAAAAAGEQVEFFTAWSGALAYTFQLYFDFSGYSDMAIGLAMMFGIRLPLNFFSPYKAANIIEFWRRWHMTLSRFLRDYLYIALGGNRNGNFKRYRNLLLTMILGGMWHGAGWTFLIWGALHGAYLLINHAWRRWPGHVWLPRPLAWLLTFLAVVVSWVFFRAVDTSSAGLILAGMVGMHGAELPPALAGVLQPLAPLLTQLGVGFNGSGAGQFIAAWLWILVLAALALLAPNAVQVSGFQPIDQPIEAPRRLSLARWPKAAMLATGAAFALGVLALTQVSEFLYFQF